MKKAKILLIEDDYSLAENLLALLEEEGYKVEYAADGDEGLKIAYNFLPDLIICDILMPKKDGYLVKEILNKDERTFDIPFLYLTAKTRINDLRKGMNLGAEDYIFKPYKSKNILELIKFRIEKKKRSQEKILAKFTKDQINDSITVNTGKEIKIIKYGKVKAILAESQYSNILLENNHKILLRKSLNEWEQLLPEKLFVRINRSAIVNKDQIQKIKKVNNKYLLALNEEKNELIISRKYYDKLKIV